MFVSQRMSRIKPSPTLAVSARAAELKAQGQDIISLGAGEPDFDTPDHIKLAATIALSEGKTKYTAVEGTVALRQAIVEKFKREDGLDYDLNQIIVSAGAKQVIFNAFLASLSPGDEVIIPAPYWVSYPDMVEIAEGVPVIVRCLPEGELKLTPDLLSEAITPKSKWLILNSPNNPSGMAYTRKELEALAEIIREVPHLNVISDDIYERLIFDELKFATLAQAAPDLKDRILTVNGVSKTYAMTGWRIGYGAGPLELIDVMTTLQSQSTSNACTISQAAAVAALKGSQDFIKEWSKVYTERRDAAHEILSQTPGLHCFRPHGAFYLYPSCAELMGKKTPEGVIISSDTDVATYLLDSVGVAVVPGISFGLSPYFRISYATDTKLLLEGCRRISQALSLLR